MAASATAPPLVAATATRHADFSYGSPCEALADLTVVMDSLRASGGTCAAGRYIVSSTQSPDDITNLYRLAEIAADVRAEAKLDVPAL